MPTQPNLTVDSLTSLREGVRLKVWRRLPLLVELFVTCLIIGTSKTSMSSCKFLTGSMIRLKLSRESVIVGSGGALSLATSRHGCRWASKGRRWHTQRRPTFELTCPQGREKNLNELTRRCRPP